MTRREHHESHAGTQVRPSWGGRLTGIEGLRGLAALTVVVAHIRVHTAKDVNLGVVGDVIGALDGLTLFFVLSGFLLYRPFATAIVTGGRPPRTGRFLNNRLVRIFPGYIAIFLLASYLLQTTYTRAALGSEGFAGARNTLGPVMGVPEVLLNLSMLQTLYPETLKTGLGVAWSLTTELCFYLVLPALAWVGLRAASAGMSRPLAAWWVPAALVLVGTAGKVVSAATLTGGTDAEVYDQEWGPTWHAVFERSLLTKADLFGYGAAAAVVLVLIEQGRLPARLVRAVRWAAVGGFLATGAMLIGPGLPSVLGTRRWEVVPVAIACGALVLWSVLRRDAGRTSVVGWVCERRPLQYLGLISYSVYLWHLPVLWWLWQRGLLREDSAWGLVGNVLLVVSVTIALSSITYHLVEAPAMRLKKRTDQRGAARGDGNGQSGAAAPSSPDGDRAVGVPSR